MPGPSYRSKSVRRFNETNCRITSLIENKTSKVLAAASIQLFISTPQLEKWFKSSTGTVCFMKDITRKNAFGFRLYSLMQGQLWEQEMQTPFTYKKLSPIFHYLAVNRFNFGFKFICEDEAERFYSAIFKYSLENRHETIGSSPFNTKRMAQSLLLNSTTISHGNSIPSISNQVEDISTLKKKSNSPFGHIANAAAAVAASATSFMGGNQSQSSSTHSLTNSSSFKISSKPHPIFSPSLLCSSRSPGVACDTYIGSNHRSRRFHSTDRSQKAAVVKKSDISCPFRCSRKDLNTSGYELNATENSLKAPNSFFANNTVLNKASPDQRTRSVNCSMNRVSLKSIESVKELNDKKLNVSLISTASSTASVSSSRTSSKEHNKSTKQILETTCSTLKKSDSPMGLQSFTLVAKNNSNNNTSLEQHENPELEVTKQILMEYNVPINKRIMTDLRNYIIEYGGIDRFQHALKSEPERNKLNLFIAQTSANLISKGQKTLNCSRTAVQNTYVDIHQNKTSSPTKHKYQVSTSNLTSSPSTPHKQTSLKPPVMSNYNNANVMTPITPTLTSTHSIKSQIKHFNMNANHQPLTPVSMPKCAVTGQPPAIPQSDRTPIRVPNHLINRNQTPSPSRSYQLRQSMANNTTMTPSSIEANAPPKPPRHASLKLAT